MINNTSMRTADLLSIARSGVDASNQLLTTAGHNIANVNTEGYVRERTSFVAQLTGGVGQGTTERIINVFAQNQLRRDTTLESHYQEYWDKTAVVDNLFASEANSISSSMSRFFASIQTASDDPTSIAARQLLLGEANSMIGQIGTMAGFLRQKEQELNLEIQSNIDRVNSLVKSIAELNDAVRVNQANNRHVEPGSLKNERDKAILELASLMSIETRVSANDDGAVLVNLTSGESLVLQDGSFNLFTINNSADLNYKSLQLNSNGKPTTLNLKETNMGGTIGGLYRYRDEVLESSRRELGQLALAVSETMNTQNRLGMDFDQQLGTDIFTLPEFTGLNYKGNSVGTEITGRIAQGQASQITSADYQVTFDAVTAGAPPTVNVTVAMLNPDGSPVKDVNGVAISQSYTGLTAQNGVFNQVMGGIEIEFNSGASYAVGDQFLLQPTKNTADKIVVSMTRPEDIALASPIRVEANIANLGDVELVSSKVPNTLVDNTFLNSAASAFNGAGGIHGPGAAPGGGVGAPAQILFTDVDEYQVLDSAGNLITTVSGTTDFTNMLAQAAVSGAAPPWPAAFSALDNYPGYDISLQGVPKAGDSFSISYNTDGLNDNRNGLLMADLQNIDSMQLNNSGSGNRVSFHEAYANIVSDIGQKSASADISLKAAQALKSQSKDWFESISGVSLDEEAANLVRYQQSYSAAARLLGTAQDLFNTILGIVR
ncbi:FlgK family flagellar hook-associated protein [Paraglaciecola hydrolytica]|uniref:Flagellar hook-associated protein 1 n=1 Tax=Paraglaciecola hydrolytica TaxID=1799789 RepID=A0A148KNJ4_9ALTE|nr:flagellar basal body rod C-terminal domain-containing protein [Paraglaciecola hydrolytica]KXI27893.1 flagellar biosynthesis protein FlgK [Paraglaciecola hydrolytica]